MGDFPLFHTQKLNLILNVERIERDSKASRIPIATKLKFFDEILEY